MSALHDVRRQIEAFLSCSTFAVIGASEDPAKFGYRVFAGYLRHGKTAYPINPRGGAILGHEIYPALSCLPEPAEAVSIITPPVVTERVIEEVIAHGVRQVWIQPGAESPAAVRKAEAAGLSVISGGPCVLVELNRR